ncbi:MAG: cytochrome c oxidase subunit 4 [Anaerolineaceae bacterium]|nr:cytochrome c oxidase subunit 4 [Anaerolineaceae bacterium]
MVESPQHLPKPSIWPILVATGITLMVAGVLSHWLVSAAGIILLIVSVGGWTQENREQARDTDEPEPDEEAAHE